MIRTEAFCETGSEGIHWSLYDTSKKGYDGLITLSKGDFITVFDKTNKGVVWSGEIKPDYQTNRMVYPYYAKFLDKPGEFRHHLLKMNGILDMDELTEPVKNLRDGIMSMSHSDCVEYLHLYHSQQVINGYWVHWVQEDVDPTFWLNLFLQELPCIIEGG